MEKSYKQIMPQITTLIFDVDGVLTDGTVHVTLKGEMLRTMNIKDGYALKSAVNAGYNVCIISGGTNEGVRKRLEGLGVKDVYLGAHYKTKQLHEYLEKKNVKLENVMYMGDDVPDFPVMQLVGLPCCPRDAAYEVQEIAKYISQKNGGKGCARDVIEQIMRVQGKWDGKFDAKYD